MGDGLAELLLRHAIFSSANKVRSQLLGPVKRHERRDRDEAAIAFREARALPHAGEEGIVHQIRQMGRERARSIARTDILKL